MATTPEKRRLRDCFREGFDSADDPNAQPDMPRAAEAVLRHAMSWSGPLLWGLLVGGVALPILPGGTVAAIAVGLQLAGISRLTPKLGAVTDDDDVARTRLKLVVLAWVTAVAAVAVAAGAGPNAMIPGAVLFAASKVVGAKGARGLQHVVPEVAVASLIAMSFLAHPHYLVTSGSTLTVGHAVRDVVRFVFVLVFVVGTRAQDRAEREHKARAEAAEARAERAADDERARIARDLHDVVAHHVSVMTLQAEAARTAPSDDALARIADTGRAAMRELRRMLGILRAADADDGAGIAPQPGIAQITALVDDLTAQGMPIALTIDGDTTGVPAGVALSTYRVVQEALTNVRKHTSAASVAVEVHCTPAHVEVRVTDDGVVAARVGGSALSTGHGLIGMRERVALVGGTLDAGPGEGGRGWTVHAVLPAGDA